MFLIELPQIVETNNHSKIMMIGHCTASRITHYYASNVAAIFVDFTLREPQTPSLSHPDV